MVVSKKEKTVPQRKGGRTKYRTQVHTPWPTQKHAPPIFQEDPNANHVDSPF